jgi:hypothetical protein
MFAEFWRKLWSFQWKYVISFAVLIILILLGAIVDYVLGGKGITLPNLPYNFYIIIVFGAFILFFHLRYKNHPAILWISSVPAAISTIVGYIICLFLSWYFPQIENPNSLLGLTGVAHIKSSYIFLFLNIYILTCLGFAIMRRLYPVTLKNIWFLLHHFGLLLLIISTGLGSSDIKRVNINLLENEEQSNIGIASNGDMYHLPFTLKLLDFSLLEYNPKIAIMDTSKGMFHILEESKRSFSFQKGNSTLLSNWYITINKFSSNTYSHDSLILHSDIPGSCPAAFIELTNYKRKKMQKGWISTGSYNQKRQMIPLEAGLVITLTNSDLAKQLSRITIQKDSLLTDTLLEVNKPVKIGGWRLYQAGYDKSKSKWSTLSVIEAVNDPWRKFSLMGLTMVVAGMFSLLIFRNKQ